MTHGKKEIITLTFEIDINDLQALHRFNAKHDPPTSVNEYVLEPDEREHLFRAVAVVVANAFTPLKLETGLQLRSLTREEYVNEAPCCHRPFSGRPHPTPNGI
ncbi:hypothetical protein [Arthrobacter alpinus]|uniref:hypothetical protein n=1 Tax=Arthrobacter alpinus TaxID=656366 RepID=UPI0012FED679|nr:hypothetical protein [Arthrobacter alpinus]